MKDETKQSQITYEHVPVSVSVFSYVPEYDWYLTLWMVSFNGSKCDYYCDINLMKQYLHKHLEVHGKIATFGI